MAGVRCRATLILQGTGIMVLKQILQRSSSLLAAAALAFVLGFAAAWFAMGAEINDIRTELLGELDAVRTGLAALDGDAEGQIADLDRRLALIERQLGLVPALLRRSAPEADAEVRPPLPPPLPPGR